MEARSLYLGSVVTVAVAIALFSVVHTTQLISLLTLILLIPLSFVLGNQIVKPGIANRNMLVETVIQKELCRYVWVFSACWGIVGLAFGVMSSATNRSLPASDSFPWIVVFSVILLGAFILVLFGRRFTFGNSADMAISIDKPEKDKELAETNRYSIITLTVVMTLIIINTVLPHVTGKGFNSVLTMDLASIVSFSLIELCTLVLFIVFSRRLDIEPTMIYAFGAGGRSLGAAVGNLIGMALGGESLAASSALVAVPLTVIAQVITAIALLLAFVPLKKLGELQNNNEKWKSPVSERCEKLAKRYKLTQRETEVMVLLAKGRSLERVQKELFIAKGTATAHAHHIYQKLGIHSRQELMDLVDGRLPQERQ